MKTFVVPKDIYDGMVAHCLEGMPNEAADSSAGRSAGTRSVATKLYPMTNAAASPVFYRPDDREIAGSAQGHGRERARRGLDLPLTRGNPGYPSPTDIREAHYPDAVFVIVSFENRDDPYAKDTSSNKQDWRDATGEVEEVELVVE